MHGSDSLTTGTDSNSVTETLCRTNIPVKKSYHFHGCPIFSHIVQGQNLSYSACTRNTHSLWHTHTYMGTWTSYRQGPGIRQNMAVVTTHTHTHTRTHTHTHTHHTTPHPHTTPHTQSVVFHSACVCSACAHGLCTLHDPSSIATYSPKEVLSSSITCRVRYVYPLK